MASSKNLQDLNQNFGDMDVSNYLAIATGLDIINVVVHMTPWRPELRLLQALRHARTLNRAAHIHRSRRHSGIVSARA